MPSQISRSIYQLKVTLQGVRPPIWRRFLVSSSANLDELHIAIQIVMGWGNCHLHQFISNQNRYGVPNDEFDSSVLDDLNFRINELLKNEKDSLIYEYDFGDSWSHKVILEKILPYTTEAELPICVKGKRACPPEDVGGIGGYDYFLEVINNPADEEHEDMLEWVGGKFEPEFFDLLEVNRLLKEYG